MCVGTATGVLTLIKSLNSLLQNGGTNSIVAMETILTVIRVYNIQNQLGLDAEYMRLWHLAEVPFRLLPLAFSPFLYCETKSDKINSRLLERMFS